MDCIGEIYGRGAVRQGEQVAPGREAEYLVLEHLQLRMFQELLRFRGMFENIQ